MLGISFIFMMACHPLIQLLEFMGLKTSHLYQGCYFYYIFPTYIIWGGGGDGHADIYSENFEFSTWGFLKAL